MFSALKNKKKIVIISSPRTGSTPLLYDIHHYLEQNDNRLLLLNEPIVKPEKTNSNKITSGDIDIIICKQKYPNYIAGVGIGGRIESNTVDTYKDCISSFKACF